MSQYVHYPCRLVDQVPERRTKNVQANDRKPNVPVTLEMQNWPSQFRKGKHQLFAYPNQPATIRTTPTKKN